MKKNVGEQERGITLVALVVTIVVLLILAGITIYYVMGDNSVFAKAQNAKLEYQIAQAREKLEITLGQVQIPKRIDPKYNQDDYLDDLMKKEISDIKIKGDIIIVDGYAFEIDRSVPKIGQYLGKEEELVFPEITTTVTTAQDNQTATIYITAKEEKNGISKIEVIQGGFVLETYECGNTKEEIEKIYIVKQNGTYTVKVYAGLTASERVIVDGIVASIEYSPNGDETYKKQHQVEISVSETDDRAKSIKYQWLNTTVEPTAETFSTTCKNGETITKNGVTGTYYLWTLLETEKGKTRIERSEGFNFDNQGPIVTITSTPVSTTSFTLTATAHDNHIQIAKYDFYINNKLEKTIETNQETASFTVTEANTGNTSCYVIVVDTLGNESKKTVTASTKLYAWERWSVNVTNVYDKYLVGISSCSQSGKGANGYYTAWSSYTINSNTGCFEGAGGSSRHQGYVRTNCMITENYGSDLLISKGGWRNYIDGFTPTCSFWCYERYKSKIVDTIKSKGATKYTDVTNKSSSAYPNNGNSGSYWYVYKGEE